MEPRRKSAIEAVSKMKDLDETRWETKATNLEVVVEDLKVVELRRHRRWF